MAKPTYKNCKIPNMCKHKYLCCTFCDEECQYKCKDNRHLCGYLSKDEPFDKKSNIRTYIDFDAIEIKKKRKREN